MIEADDLCVSIGHSAILHRVGFVARPGEVTCIVGPNGSGKSTLVKALSGDLPFTGSVRIHGTPLDRLRAGETAGLRAVLPQSTSLAFPFTVHEIVRLGLMGGRSGVPAKFEQDLPARALRRVELDGFAGRYYQELSGGEQQRVQLARVLCQVWEPVLDGTPRYLFLDEPVASLDIRHQLVIMGIAREFARAGGGVVAVMHDLNLTAMFADTVTMLRRGRVVASGTPAQVMTDSLVGRVFDCDLKVGAVPAAGTPFVLPQSIGA